MTTPHLIRVCQACGAAVEVSDHTISTSCVYCRSQLVDSDRARVAIDRVAPFRIPRSAAEDRLRAYVADDIWAPRKIRAAARTATVVNADISGVLIPFYAYTATVKGQYRARVGVDWFREVSRKNKKGELETVQVRETEWFGLRGSMADELEDHLVPASAGLTKAEATALLPFDLGRSYAFDPHYLAGFHAELPSRTRREVDSDAQESIRAVCERTVRRRLLPGDQNKLDRLDADVSIHQVHLMLLPVWVASFRVSGRVIRLLVHGQTGRCSGRVPVSPAKVALAIAVGAAVLIALYVLLGGSESWT